MTLEMCVGCKALVPRMDGPRHRYMESAPGCWARFGAILEREYSDPTYMRNHRLTVDAYAVQHPGQPSPQSTQSVCLHLVSLHLVFECDVSQSSATRALQHLAKHKDQFCWLEPPESLGDVTVNDVVEATNADEHADAVTRWARSAWGAWAPHHPKVQQWANALGGLGN